MNSILPVFAAFIVLIAGILAYLLVMTKSRLTKTINESKLHKDILEKYAKIDDAEAALAEFREKSEKATQQLEDKIAQSHETSTRIQELNKSKVALEEKVRKYREVVGDFKSVTLLRQQIQQLKSEVGLFQNVRDLDNEIRRKNSEINQLSRVLGAGTNARELPSRIAYLNNLIAELKNEVDSIEETRDVQQFGIYRPQFDFDHSSKYKEELNRVVDQQKALVKSRDALLIPEGITVGGDESAGKKLGEEYGKVMMRAFNGEADAAIAKARYNNMAMLQKRISKSWEAINKLGNTMNIQISSQYFDLRVEELKLAYEFERKKQEEREEQAYLKELAREEDKARKEAEKAKSDAEAAEKKEKERLAEKERLLEELKADLESRQQNLSTDAAISEEEKLNLESSIASQLQKIGELETQRDTLLLAVKTAHEHTERAVSLAQLTKRGHVYVLSNIGSFGENCFKIGMTRRDDPNLRVKELASASVPFPFDVHAMILTNDAPALEAKLHQRFDGRRVNKVNSRKEFFCVTITEIQDAVDSVCESTVELKQVIPEAAEYRETIALRTGSSQQMHAAAT